MCEEVLLLCTKPGVKLAIRRFDLDVVVPPNKRIIRLRVDKGSKFTGKEFRDICTEFSIRLEFAVMTTSKQIGV